MDVVAISGAETIRYNTTQTAITVVALGALSGYLVNNWKHNNLYTIGGVLLGLGVGFFIDTKLQYALRG